MLHLRWPKCIPHPRLLNPILRRLYAEAPFLLGAALFAFVLLRFVVGCAGSSSTITPAASQASATDAKAIGPSKKRTRFVIRDTQLPPLPKNYDPVPPLPAVPREARP